ncbi:hypothetical protein sphantq_00687 [Sphingobium sp. AntQ-1]|uniref:cupin n=1 Tax=Sphingobium sp. AntQ-1 TaxID=2930091 RepID=UPI00234E3847|nr:cupin [Sphingobium sp. AntQ-1]WCP12290.1 hypothetical protein sphantq_00687 [Sphingobium sp. AntQ-1]
MEIATFLLAENDWVPNNARLPVILYRGVENGPCETIAKAFEDRFALNGWPPKWRDTIFGYHHYHSTSHEALGVAAGNATLELGGPGGRTVEVTAGDVLLLPVGTGHRRISQSKDFLVVGAYPDGEDWDICRSAPDNAARRRIATLKVPERDPIGGGEGPMTTAWPC